jgi:hypothetical protein
MKYAVILVCLLVLGFHPATGQQSWTVGEKYLEYKGEPRYLSGINFIPSTGWLLILEDWDPAAIERDMETMSRFGIQYLRFAPLWHLTQPAPDRLDETILERIDDILDLAEKYDVYLQLIPLTGWMSGGSFLPDWAVGIPFSDPDIIRGEVYLIEQLTRRYKDHPRVMSYGFGNEVEALYGNMKLDCTEDEIHSWLETIYGAFRENRGTQPVTNGISYFDRHFDTWVVSDNVDFMSVHSYPYFNYTYKLDPWIGIRTTYSPNYIAAWAEMTGKPVLMQELGMSESWLPRMEVPKYLRLTYLSTWADGACGYFWWCSHDIPRDFRVVTDGLKPRFSVPEMAAGNFHELEYELGLFNTRNEPKPSAFAYKQCTEIVRQLGVDWIDLLPVCYVLVPETATGDDNLLELIQPYVLAKQAHMDVRLWPEWKEIPGDADVVVIAGFSLSPSGRQHIFRYLENGGTVYQSWFQDFGAGIHAEATVLERSDPAKIIHTTLGRVELGYHLRTAAPVRIRDVNFDETAEVLIRIPAEDEPVWRNRFGKVQGLMFKTGVGEGTYFYLAADLESALMDTYDPWDEDDSDLIYRLIRPQTGIDVSSKYIELYHKEKKGKQLIILLNHKDETLPVNLCSLDAWRYTDALTGKELGRGRELDLFMEPAGFELIYLDTE